MTRSTLIGSLQNYSSVYLEEEKFVRQFLDLLEHPRCFFRDHLPGHITASSWIVNRESTKVLLVHHAKLHKWLQPGGHADGDENVLEVALREADEETGLSNLKVIGDSFFDIDIHPIPARKDFPTHDHYDLRFLFQASDKDLLIISEESSDLKWVGLSDLEKYNNSPSLARMKEKALLRADQ